MGKFLRDTGSQKAAAARTENFAASSEGPEDMGLPERCLLWPTAGPPCFLRLQQQYQILQVPGYVVILIEMIHDVRINPADGVRIFHTHSPVAGIFARPLGRQYAGVDTANFTDKTHFRGADQNLHLVERFTRIDPNTILYEFTVDDPTAFTKPWKAQAPLTKTPDLSTNTLVTKGTTRW